MDPLRLKLASVKTGSKMRYTRQKAAMQEGIVPGGGSLLAKLAKVSP